MGDLGIRRTRNFVVLPKPLAEGIAERQGKLEAQTLELREKLDGTNALLITALTEMAQERDQNPRVFVLRWLREHRGFE